MTSRVRRLVGAGALVLPLGLLGCSDDGPGEGAVPPGGVEEETEQFDQEPVPESGDENTGEEASEEGNEEPATAPQVGAED